MIPVESNVQTDYQIYMPIVPKQKRFGNSKKALACAHPQTREVDAANLNMPQNYRYLIWGTNHYGVPGNVPMLWGLWKPATTFNTMIGFYNDVPRQYAGEAIFLNEPDLDVQANISARFAADLFRMVCVDYPYVKWIAPNCSHADLAAESLWLREFVLHVSEYGLIHRIHTWGLHWYDYAAQSAQWAVDKFYYDIDSVLAPNLVFKMCWLTEFGCNRRYAGYYQRFCDWTDQLIAHESVEQIFVFCNRDPSPTPNDHGLCHPTTGALLNTGEYWASL